ncbi:MAG: hypothetical protein QOE65_979 [Solirubrobacteraceae bacterium]|jgi:hypothetical protein|nr:hypothetical protein [Solirubrobacteraceae bacterium]
MSRRGACVASLTLAALVAMPVAAPAARHRGRCAMPGRTVLRTSLIRVVRVEDTAGESVTMSGCAFATNRVFELASGVQADTTDTSLGLDRHSGTWVGVSTSTQNQYGFSGATRVTNVRNGRGYTLTSYTVGLGEPGPGTSLVKYGINDRGQAAAAFQDNSTAPNQPPRAAATRIVAVSSNGTQRLVDFGAPADLPASSLQLDRKLFIWTHSGQLRYAWL